MIVSLLVEQYSTVLWFFDASIFLTHSSDGTVSISPIIYDCSEAISDHGCEKILFGSFRVIPALPTTMEFAA